MASSSELSYERSLKQMIDDNYIDGVVEMIKTSDVNADLKDRPLLQYVNGEQKTLLQYMIELGKVEMLTCLIHTRHTTCDHLQRRNRLVGYSDLTYRNRTNETSIHSIFKAPLESIEPMWNYIQKRYKYIPEILNWMDLRSITPFYIALQNVIECLRQQWSDIARHYINFMITLLQVNRHTIYLRDYINTIQETELRKEIKSQTLLIPYNLGNQLLVLLEGSNTIIDADSDSTDDEEDDMLRSGPPTRPRRAGLRFKF